MARRTNTRHVQKFDSLDALIQQSKTNVAHAASERGLDPVAAAEHCHLLTNDLSWRGREWANLDAFWASLSEPWADGLEIFERLRSRVDLPTQTARRRRRRWNEDGGDEVCPDRLNLGSPYWSGMKRVERHANPIIHLLTDVSTSAGVSHENMLWRGVAAFVIADRLEDAGFSVQLSGFNNVTNGYSDGAAAMQVFTIKEAHQPLNVGTLLNSISAWFYRTVVFSSFFKEGLPQPDYGLGTPRPLKDEDIADLDGDLVIDGAFSEDDAIRVIEETLERFL